MVKYTLCVIKIRFRKMVLCAYKLSVNLLEMFPAHLKFTISRYIRDSFKHMRDNTMNFEKLKDFIMTRDSNLISFHA